MPRYKQYAPLDHGINADGEVWAFTQEFGDRSFRTLVQVFIILDQSENRWRLVGEWLATLSRTVRQLPASVRRQIDRMIANGWLIVDERAADGSPSVLSAPNYWKFHRRPEPKKHLIGTVKPQNTVAVIGSSLTLQHTTEEKKLNKEKNFTNGVVSHGTVGNRVVAAPGKYDQFE